MSPKSVKKLGMVGAIAIILFFAMVQLCFSNSSLPNSNDILRASKKAERGVVLVAIVHTVEDMRGQRPNMEMKSYFNGIVIDRNGYILVPLLPEETKIIKIAWNQSEEDTAKLIAKDERRGICILKIDTKKELFPVEFGNSADIQNGEWVVIVGAAGENYKFNKYFTYGMVASRVPKDKFEELIMSISDIEPLSQRLSGMPIVNFNGDVVGITISQRMRNTIFICTDEIKKVIKDLIKEEKIEYGWIGAVVRPLTKAYAEYLRIADNGVIAEKVFKNSPAEKGGLQADDIIIEINGKKFLQPEEISVSEFERNLYLVRTGEEVKFKVLRNNETKEFAVKAEKEPKAKENKNKKWGFSAKEITEALSFNYNLASEDGIYISQVERGGPAQYAGIREGDIIVRIKDLSINGFKDYEKALDLFNGKNEMLVDIVRGRMEMSTVIKSEVGAESK